MSDNRLDFTLNLNKKLSATYTQTKFFHTENLRSLYEIWKMFLKKFIRSQMQIVDSANSSQM